ncbi:Fruiting body protein SC7 OS=Schizophyllum commune GN=SC7 PE=2 SV=1 [Rhizoctonia solani AG-1 IB]|uniref:Fruiting body protein SC7 n=1 Tax=Thanatephorus cucumeris (strain AG1-IB / isolate 7/3/14) TaxID=1108050 RepID=A0A0B7FMQ6_THACB|nr:Fruiting body protein SC7 OS=Schizophyllum commune GN=SC7 PE=2 SV=1 [Rhizoctonia solani AG-1 IB]
MVHLTTSILALAVAAGSVSAHWRDSTSRATEIHMTGTHLGFNATSLLSARAVPQQQQYLDAHNNERAKHGAKALVWDDALSASAQAWANQCKFQHSQAGQNLAAGTGNPSAATAVGWWNDESKDYNPSNPQYSHWTQVVWKSTTKLGCAMKQCAAGTIFDASYVANYFVCHYSPYGNVIGQFPQNVQK